MLAVAVLIGMVWFLATRSSRSSAVSEAAGNVATSAAAPTLTGELAASTAISPVPTKSSAVSGSVSPSGSATGSSAAGSSAAAASPAASVPAASVPAAAAAPAASAAPAAAPSSPAAPAPAPAATPAAPAPEPAPAPETAPAPEPAPAPAPPSYDAQGKLLCADADISLAAAPSAPTFVVGVQPRLLLTVTNTGQQACQRDVSGSLQTFTVFGADGSRIWSTADCFPGTGTEVRELAPGQQLQYTIKWSGTTSAPGCTGARSAVPDGAYTVIGQLGGLSSPPATFTVTG